MPPPGSIVTVDSTRSRNRGRFLNDANALENNGQGATALADAMLSAQLGRQLAFASQIR
jgi:hypothetical protein